MDPNNNLDILLPYEEWLSDREEKPTYKQLTQLDIHNIGWGYTCLVKSFMIFISEKPIKLKKSPVLNFFNSISEIAQFEALGLPIEKKSSTTSEAVNCAFEISLRSKRTLQ